MNNFSYTFRVAILFISVLVFVFSPFTVANAQIPFGGVPTLIIPNCIAPPGMLYALVGVGPGFLFYLLTPPAPYYPIVPGKPTLGLAAAAPVPCMIYAGLTLVTVGVGFPVLLSG